MVLFMWKKIKKKNMQKYNSKSSFKEGILVITASEGGVSNALADLTNSV